MIAKLQNWLYAGNRIERIWLLSKIEFRLRYYGNKLGLIWALINPLSRICMFYIMFIIILDGNQKNFFAFLFSGFLLWIFFTDVTNRSMNILKSKQRIYEHTDIDKIEIYISLLVSSTIGLAFNFGIFIIICLVSGIIPSWHFLMFPVLYINLAILSVGFALILSNLFVLFIDITQIWGIVTTILFFLSPILFRGDLIAAKIPILNYINPISGIVNNTRAILLEQQLPDLEMVLFNYVYAILILLIGIYLFKSISHRSSELT